jgi:hypothetical protein
LLLLEIGLTLAVSSTGIRGSGRDAPSMKVPDWVSHDDLDGGSLSTGAACQKIFTKRTMHDIRYKEIEIHVFLPWRQLLEVS